MIAALKKYTQTITPLPTPVSLEQFIDWYPENSQYRYELYRGAIIQMPKPRGKHSEIAGSIHDELAFQIRSASYSYFIPRECIVKISDDTGLEPDAIVLDRSTLEIEPLWEKASTIQNGSSVRLIVEVVSGNWQDDYERKLTAYEAIGIPEYWIVDYAGIGGVRHIGRPKQPTLTVCTRVDGEYEVTRLRVGDKIESGLSPEFGAIAEQILQSHQA